MGKGLYIKNAAGSFKAQPQGNGLYLRPYNSAAMSDVGQGIYMKTGNGFIPAKQRRDGSGLILGENSPFKNVPILGWIL